MNFQKDTIKPKKLISFIYPSYGITYHLNAGMSDILSSLYIVIYSYLQYIYIYIYIYLYICQYLYNLSYTKSFSLLNCCWHIKTNNGFSKFIFIKKLDYKYHHTAVIIHLEIIYFDCLVIVLFILLYFACKSTIFILGVGFFALVEEGRVEGVLVNVELFLVGHEHW